LAEKSLLKNGILCNGLALVPRSASSQKQQPYAQPDPAFIEKYGQPDAPQFAGEWVIVPGQHVNGVWVREHKVWVPGSR